MAWTNVSKPTTPTWTNTTAQGKTQYDQSDVEFNDSNIYYDTVNYLAYTRVENPSVAWNLDRASFVASHSVSAQTPRPKWVFFKPDGTKMYVGDGDMGVDIYEYNLSTAWDFATLVYVQTKTLASVVYSEAGFFKPDGTKMYIVDGTPNTVREYDLSTAWNVSTATFLQQIDITTQDDSPTGLYFSPDGTKMFSTGDTGAEVNEFDLSIAWNVSTAIFRQRKDISTQTTSPDGIFFRNDGLRLYVSSYSGIGKIFEYTLVVPWDISTAQFLKSLTIIVQNLDTFSVFFRGDGLEMYVVSANNATIREYEFTGQYTNVSKPT